MPAPFESARIAAPPIARRSFLQLGAATAVAAGLGSPVHAAVRPRPVHRVAPKARNIIFMVSDGMSSGTLALAQTFSARQLGRDSHWARLWKRPGVRRSSATTHSADSIVTDSAAGGAAWGCGEHCNNEQLNWTPDGRQPVPILVQARQQGKATGLVTTARVTHATPASFIVNCPKRDLEDQIAAQMLERGFDVALGGGAKHFPDELVARHSGYTVVRDRAALLASPTSGPLLGLFHKSHMSYALDRPETEPTLAEMTRAALSRLAASPNGFVMQIEGGRIDHGAHDNDAGALLFDQLAFDEAIGAATEFIDGRDDTLLILTSDHGNANPGFTLYTRRGEEAFPRLANLKHSFEWLSARMAKTPKDQFAKRLHETVREATGVTLADDEMSMLMASYAGKRVSAFAELNSPACVLGGLLANTIGVSFMSPNHTADLVEVTAAGPGAEDLPELIDNIDLWKLMVGAMDLAPAKPLG